jgi:hypothetical protein
MVRTVVREGCHHRVGTVSDAEVSTESLFYGGGTAAEVDVGACARHLGISLQGSG